MNVNFHGISSAQVSNCKKPDVKKGTFKDFSNKI